MKHNFTTKKTVGRLLALIAVVFPLLVATQAAGQNGSNDDTFMSYTTGITPGNRINSQVEVLPSGKLLALGGLKGIYRLNANGTIDETFNAGGSGAGGGISKFLVLSSGKLLVSGPGFTSYNGTPVGGFARLNENGTLDATFNPKDKDGNAFRPTNFAAQATGKIVVSAPKNPIDDFQGDLVFRINADGSYDNTFKDGTTSQFTIVRAILIRPTTDKIILIGGMNGPSEGQYAVGTNAPTRFEGILQLLADGTVDGSFSQLTNPDALQTAVLQTDGKIVVSFYVGGKQKLRRINTDGTVDGSLLDGEFTISTGNLGYIYGLYLQPDGDIVVFGKFKFYQSVARNGIVRINSDGSLDTGFDPAEGFSVSVGSEYPSYVTRLSPTGSYVVTGGFTSYRGISRQGMVFITDAGANDATLGSYGYGFDNSVNNLLVQADNKILAVGNFTSLNGTPTNRIARLNTDGTPDNTFVSGTGFDAVVNTIVKQADGKLWVGGSFTNYNGNLRNGLVRLTADGAYDAVPGSGFGPNENVSALAIQPSDGNVFVGGPFTTYNGATVKPLLLINKTNGQRITTFNLPSTYDYWTVNAIAIQADGKILVGGNFTKDFITAPGIVRLSATGALDPTFKLQTGGPEGFSTNVSAIAILPDGKILIGGLFTSYNGTDNRNNLALLDADGNLLPGFATGTDGTVNSITVRPDGKILIGGDFTSPKPKFVLYNADGSVDNTFNTGTGPNGPVYAMALQADGKILVGGPFSNYNGTPRDNLARVNVSSCTTITVGPASLAAATQGAAYNQPLTATGGTGTPTFAVSTGTLPAGLALSTAGLLSGTPTTAGSSTFTVTATASGCTGSKSYTLVVNPVGCPTITVGPASLAAATQGTAYNQPLTATGGTGTPTFAVTSGTLPAGLSVTTAGLLSGTPTAAGSSTFTVTATASGCTGSKSYTLVVNPACPTILISPASLAAATQGTVYSQPLTATGGTSTPTFSVTSGTLPAGLGLTTAGLLSGTPTSLGSSTFTVKATVGGCEGTKSYTLTVGCPTITVGPASLAAATQGTVYSQPLTATGGTGIASFAVTTGTLPAGLSLTTAGVLSGTPTTVGSSTFTVTAVIGGCTGAKEYTLIVTCPIITILPASLPFVAAKDSYSQTLTATGGTSPYTFAVTGGALPIGLTLNPSSGALAGFSSVEGNASFTITVTDGNGCKATKEYSLCINPKPMIIPSLQNNYAQFVLLSSSPTANQWFKDGLLINGAIEPEYRVTSLGVYQVQVTVGGCAGKSTAYTVDVTTALEPTTPSELTVFPNPAHDKLHVEYASTQDEMDLSIVTSLGVVVFTSHLQKNSENLFSVDLDLSRLAPGSYLLQLNGSGQEGNTLRQRFVKH